MSKQAQKFDYEALVRAAEHARKEIADWPEWKRRAADAVFVTRPEVEVTLQAPGQPEEH